MKTLIVIPAHNEQDYIKLTLDSLLAQTIPVTRIIVVNDNSTDQTEAIVEQYTAQYNFITLINKTSQAQNIPGSKVIQAFKAGLVTVELSDFDIICKFDADLIFPETYIEAIHHRFGISQGVGMVGGHCSIEINNQWIIENINNPDHIRGAIKAYRKECFQEIGGLRSSIGWDTVDEMLARFFKWEVVTVPDLHVKHLKPTGASYSKKARYAQGEAFYKMRLGLPLTAITALKMGSKKNSFKVVLNILKGYFQSEDKVKPIVTNKQGAFIRSYRWKGIRKKLGI